MLASYVSVVTCLTSEPLNISQTQRIGFCIRTEIEKKTYLPQNPREFSKKTPPNNAAMDTIVTWGAITPWWCMPWGIQPSRLKIPGWFFFSDSFRNHHIWKPPKVCVVFRQVLSMRICCQVLCFMYLAICFTNYIYMSWLTSKNIKKSTSKKAFQDLGDYHGKFLFKQSKEIYENLWWNTIPKYI